MYTVTPFSTTVFSFEKKIYAAITIIEKANQNYSIYPKQRWRLYLKTKFCRNLINLAHKLDISVEKIFYCTFRKPTQFLFVIECLSYQNKCLWMKLLKPFSGVGSLLFFYTERLTSYKTPKFLFWPYSASKLQFLGMFRNLFSRRKKFFRSFSCNLLYTYYSL